MKFILFIVLFGIFIGDSYGYSRFIRNTENQIDDVDLEVENQILEKVKSKKISQRDFEIAECFRNSMNLTRSSWYFFLDNHRFYFDLYKDALEYILNNACPNIDGVTNCFGIGMFNVQPEDVGKLRNFAKNILKFLCGNDNGARNYGFYENEADLCVFIKHSEDFRLCGANNIKPLKKFLSPDEEECSEAIAMKNCVHDNFLNKCEAPKAANLVDALLNEVILNNFQCKE